MPATFQGTRSFWRTFDSPFRTTGTATSSEVPSRYDMAINGRGYMLDLASGDFGMETIQVSRAQSDVSNSPSEASLSRDDLWRRAFESWHHGAGQVWRDRATADEFRFRSSLGVDVWTRDALSLLPSTSMTRALSTATPLLATAANYIYATDTSTVYYSTDAAAWTSATYGGTTITGLCSDGTFVYVTDGTAIWQSTPGGAFASWNTLDATLIDFVNGRLMCAGAGATKHVLYNVLTSAPPAALYTHPNTAWTWTAFAQGQSAIYAAGYAGDKSAIYAITIKSDGTGLVDPVVALQLPDGEICYSLTGYLDFLAIGTSEGMRLAALGTTLTAGSPLDVGTVRALEGQDRFIWFGWTNYDATHTGLGRADLSVFTNPLAAAYASDLMAVAQGVVNAVVTFAGKRVFAVAASGVWVEQTTLVATGTIDSGWVTFGLSDAKVLQRFDVLNEPLLGAITVWVARSDGLFDQCFPAADVAGATRTAVFCEKSSDRFELRVALARLATAAGPKLTRVTMLANPVPARSEVWTLPILLGEELETANGVPQRWQASDEIDFFRLLADSGSLVTQQFAENTDSVFVVDFQWRPTHLYVDKSDWNGTLVVRCKAPPRRST